MISVTLPGTYALTARAHFEEFGGTRADLAATAVKNHRNAPGNDMAQFQKEISTTDVLEAPTVADPLGLCDARPITDGASARVHVSEAYAAHHDLNESVAITEPDGRPTRSPYSSESRSRGPRQRPERRRSHTTTPGLPRPTSNCLKFQRSRQHYTVSFSW
ncbi:hypothetical protein [Halorubrum sp. Ea1]|uniref:hypothetical protein n=1 Tax=Halorubrum sp. Ea1 TaxID=1480718 RepID=UPI0020CC2DBC|nr:hypothetical protein [Halorubrum sp. Ea1]